MRRSSTRFTPSKISSANEGRSERKSASSCWRVIASSFLVDPLEELGRNRPGGLYEGCTTAKVIGRPLQLGERDRVVKQLGIREPERRREAVGRGSTNVDKLVHAEASKSLVQPVRVVNCHFDK